MNEKKDKPKDKIVKINFSNLPSRENIEKLKKDRLNHLINSVGLPVPIIGD